MKKGRLTAVASAALLAVSLSVPALDLAFGSDDEKSDPPAWSNAGGGGREDKADKQSKEAKQDKQAKHDAWKALAPAEKRELMSGLVREHKAGMADFQECRKASGTDCEKPLPPGLAKKQ
jgi:hypothetical protein